MNQVLLDSFIYDGKTTQLEWHDALSVDDLPDVQWQQVYVVGNLGGQVPTVLYADAHANLPGGKPETGESIVAATRRELCEEINCQVVSWHPIGYQKLIIPDESEPVYQLRVYAVLEKIGAFQNDPGGNVIGYKLVGLRELNDTIGHGKVGARVMQLVSAEYTEKHDDVL